MKQNKDTKTSLEAQCGEDMAVVAKPLLFGADAQFEELGEKLICRPPSKEIDPAIRRY